MQLMKELITPERRRVTFADVEHGGTGRFNLVVHRTDGETDVAVRSLSRYQAEEAAGVINAVIAKWIEHEEDRQVVMNGDATRPSA